MLLHDKDQSVAPEKEDLQARVTGLQQELHTTEAKMGSLEVRTRGLLSHIIFKSKLSLTAITNCGATHSLLVLSPYYVI